MANETGFGLIEIKKPKFPQRALLRVPHRKSVLTVAYPAFEQDFFKNNIEEMQKDYFHPQTGERISFREPTTSKSISVAAYDIENLAKPKIFNRGWLQLGYIVRTSEGVFVNPPRDKQGNPITDKQVLISSFINSKKVNGIWICDNKDILDFGFAPYETFEMGVQDGGKFVEGGLARILEHTIEKTAKNLKAISSFKNYPNGVNVWGFNPVKEPVLRVADLGSSWSSDGRVERLGVYGDSYGGPDKYTFGVLKD